MTRTRKIILAGISILAIIAAIALTLFLKPELRIYYYDILYRKNPNYEAKRALFIQSLKGFSDRELRPQAIMDLGSYKYSLGDNRGALRAFTLASELMPNYYVPHFNLGNIYFAEKNYEAAEREYLEALRLNPLALEVYENMESFYRIWRPSEAIAIMKQVYEEGISILAKREVKNTRLALTEQYARYLESNQDIAGALGLWRSLYAEIDPKSDAATQIAAHMRELEKRLSIK